VLFGIYTLAKFHFITTYSNAWNRGLSRGTQRLLAGNGGSRIDGFSPGGADH
jgi:hypothetical protein